MAWPWLSQPLIPVLSGRPMILQAPLASVWADLFWLVVIFLVMLLLNRWIVMHVNGVGLIISMNQTMAVWLYFFLFLPGILIHEVSHYIVAVLLRARPSKFSLWPKAKRGRVVLGSVEIRKADPLAHSLIGVAPLVVGSLAVWFIAQFLQFDRLGLALAQGDLDILFRALAQSLATPDFWLWLYLLFAISNAMLPSPADRIYWTPVLFFLGAVIVLLAGFDLFPTIPIFIQETFFDVVSILVSALTTVVVVDLLFIIFIFLLEFLLTVTTGRKIQY